MLGRFDPKTGSFSEWPSPGGAWSRPYPLLVIGNAVWYNESWMTPTTIVRFDIETHQSQSWPVENCDDGMYLFYPDKDGFWFTCHGTDRLGKVEINEGASAAKISAGAGKGER
jgi:streptogramin lyase